ncbi:hypothetical protein GCM10022291_16980 [Postechiella marina]|uniref:Uncharacterized protein n=1 Tax=Postechiella marina TaxID=943941 RepID=A0ABP8C8N7_9FLAO
MAKNKILGFFAGCVSFGVSLVLQPNSTESKNTIFSSFIIMEFDKFLSNYGKFYAKNSALFNLHLLVFNLFKMYSCIYGNIF